MLPPSRHAGLMALIKFAEKNDHAPTLVAQVRVAASIAQRKLGSLRSALRHADGAVTACESEACAHAARGAALEALGLVVDAHVAFVKAASLEPSKRTHA